MCSLARHFGSLPAIAIDYAGIRFGIRAWSPYTDLAFDIRSTYASSYDDDSTGRRWRLRSQRHREPGRLHGLAAKLRFDHFARCRRQSQRRRRCGRLCDLAQELRQHLAGGWLIGRRRPIAWARQLRGAGTDVGCASFGWQVLLFFCGSPATAGCVSRISNFSPTVCTAA